MFLSLGERSDPEELQRVAELSVAGPVHQPASAEHLPVGEGGADFRFLDDVELDVRCIAGPTRPREPTMTAIERQDGRTPRPARSPGASSTC